MADDFGRQLADLLYGSNTAPEDKEEQRRIAQLIDRERLRRLGGAAETAATIGSGILSSVPAGLAGLASMLPTRGRGPDLNKAVERVEQVQQAGTYIPRGETGQRYLERTVGALEMLGLPAEYLGEKTLQYTGSPGAATAVSVLGDPVNLIGTGLPTKAARAGVQAIKAAPRVAGEMVSDILTPVSRMESQRGAIKLAGKEQEKSIYPQAEALERARKNAVEMLGLPENNTPEMRAQAMGYIDYLHGTQRLDRLLEGKTLDPRRATSGPMPYGTTTPELASSYATSKADTSRRATDEGDVRRYFEVAPKDIGIQGLRSPLPVETAWHFMSPEQQAKIRELAPRVGYENLDEFTGNLIVHPEGVNATLSPNQWNWLMKNEAKGNPLAALRHMWYESGQLVDEPETLGQIYRLAGVNAPISQTKAPWTEAQGVLLGKARITNPIDTSNTEQVSALIEPLKQAFAKDRSKTKTGGPDQWAKESRYTPKTWVAELEKDLAEGKESYVWTSIPDKVTAELKKLGFNGIIDRSGKGGGAKEPVVIPFDPAQVRSRFAAFDPAEMDKPDLLKKTGGRVHISDNPDTMALELAVGGAAKAAKAAAKAAEKAAAQTASKQAAEQTVKSIYPQADALERARQNAVKMLGLPENNTAMDRARAMGFDDNWFHGTNRDFPAFENSMLGAKTGAKSAQKAHFLAKNPELSNTYVNTENVFPLGYKAAPPVYESLFKNKDAFAEFNAAPDWESQWRVLEKYGMNYGSGQVMPLMVRLGNQRVKDYGGAGYRDVTYNDELKAAKKGKKDSVVFKNTFDPGPHEGRNVQTDVAAIFDPSRIRSRFAAFDPAEMDKPDLLKKEGGSVHISDNPDTMRLELAGGGGVGEERDWRSKIAGGGIRGIITRGLLGMDPPEDMTPREREIYENMVRLSAPAQGIGAGKAIFIGAKAKTWNKAAANRAVEMEKAGVSPEQIWRETGTFRGADGKLRQEISDVGAVHRNPKELQELGKAKKEEAKELQSRIAGIPGQKDLFPKALTEAKRPVREQIKQLKEEADQLMRPSDTRGQSARFALEHPELYKAYPELGDIPVYQGVYGSGRELGSLRGAAGDLEMSVTQAGLRQSPRSTMLHEMQHAVQSLEDMAPGGNAAMAFQDPRAFEILQQIRQKASEPMTYDKYLETLIQANPGKKLSDISPDVARQGYESYLRSIPESVKKFDRDFQVQAANEYYKRLAGEAEARATQYREGMGLTQRREEFPYTSYDVLPEDLIVKAPKGAITAASEGKNPAPAEVAAKLAAQRQELMLRNRAMQELENQFKDMPEPPRGFMSPENILQRMDEIRRREATPPGEQIPLLRRGGKVSFTDNLDTMRLAVQKRK